MGINQVATLSLASPQTFANILCSGTALIAQVTGFMGWFLGTQALGAARVSVLLNITPLVGVALAASFLGEKITLEKVIAGVIILFGVWLANKKRPKL